VSINGCAASSIADAARRITMRSSRFADAATVRRARVGAPWRAADMSRDDCGLQRPGIYSPRRYPAKAADGGGDMTRGEQNARDDDSAKGVAE